MIPSVVATQVRNCVSDYLHTTFRPTTPGFDGLIDRFLAEPDNICRGPYISIGLPFRSGTGSDPFREIPLGFTPHLHQERAFQRLSPPYYQSTLIATGTGSGKTECFLLPLLEHCRQQQGELGIKAILIYPMNALATDQAKRIADLIHSTPSLKGISAGLYIGDQDETPTARMSANKVITDKRIIRESPPDILLTNYKMLDYLLVQPDAQQLWQHNQPNKLRYIIVDEFHTFDGAQGTDLACLLRRLKHRLKTPVNHLTCVGTSATLGSSASQKDMLAYASTIFQEPFQEGALIQEDRVTAAEFLQDALLNVLPVPGLEAIAQLNPDSYTTLEAYIRAQATLWLQDLTPPDTSETHTPLNDNWRIQLGEELKTLPIIHNLIRLLGQEARTYTDLLERLSRRLHLPNDQSGYSHLLLDSLLSLVAIARRLITLPSGKTLILPWMNLRVQLWFRELKRMVATVEPYPQLLYSDDLTPEQAKKTLPVMHCRDCGATGWGGVKPSQGSTKLVANDLQRFYREYFGRKPLITFAFPAHDTETDTRRLCPECLTLNSSKVEGCIACGHTDLIRVHIPEITKSAEDSDGQKKLVSSGDCPFCGSSNGLSILGAQAASLTSAMIGTLYTTPFNHDKKLLTFSDSVQDAAHRAGFYGARTYRTTLRTAIAHTIAANPDSITLQALVDQFPSHWQHQLGSAGNYVATFIPNDLEWLREWDEFLHSDRLDLATDTPLPALINERLTWEIVNQFGHRSAVGPSLERSGACATHFNLEEIEQAIATLHFKLTNEVDALRSAAPDRIRQFLLGLLHHLRQRGGILQPATQLYISQGNTFVLQRPLFMPSMGPNIPAPIFLVSAAGTAERFERVIKPGQAESWCENWTRRIFSATSLLLKDQLKEILDYTLNALVEAGVLEAHPCGHGRAWGIPMSVIQLTAAGTVLVCERCSHQITTAEVERPALDGMTCLNPGCSGHYHPDPRTGLAYYRQLYRSGEVRRIMAAEHTGLLSRSNREWLEQRFIQGDRRCDPNLLSATSTLEMGINIGDLSTVLLCSVPPAPANFQQRIGRAGRTDGNALVGVVANGSPHDLFFYANPTRMLAGSVEASGCYLDASAILQRQLTAFCLDNWVATGITKREFPTQLSDVLNAIERQDQLRFPYNWLAFILEQQSELLEQFLGLFTETEEQTQKELRLFMEQGEQDEGGLRWRIRDRLEGVRKERTRVSSQIKTIGKKIKDLKAEPIALQDPERLAELERERSGFRALMRNLNDKHILNFLTDEGLLPNYSFPEAGVTLQSILWRQKFKAEGDDGKKYETFTLSYERPGALAIRELVPSGVFYAEGRRVKIDQIDLKLSEPEEWRLCRSCNYTVRSIQPEAHTKACPRCNDSMWSDQGRLRRMLKLRQVMASTSDRKSRFGDDREDRSTSFFQRHLLVDFQPEFREKTFLIKDKEFPFGIEYIARTSFREVNLGESLSIGETVELAGHRFTTQGFRICRSCGKVMRGDRAKDHTISCQYRDKPDQAKALDVLYLYREFESEAIRFLMPDENFWTDQGLHSFIAALQLGLKRKFGGKVDHLHTVISEEPQPSSSLRKSFLYLFDSIPGGTGYLRQLIQKPAELRDVFAQALAVLRACDCEDGCYNCLFAYRSSFDQDETSRLAAVRLLSAIEKHWSDLEETSESLSAIRLNSNFESELERRFIEAIRRYSGKVYGGSTPILRKDIINGQAGYYLKVGEISWTIEMQVTLTAQDGVEIPSRADFVIRPASSRTHSRPIVIFTDGWEYHQDRIKEDFQQRLAILRSGQFWCWSLSWDDINAQIDPEQAVSRPNGLSCSLLPGVMERVYQQYQCQLLRPMEDLDSFEWLMLYLFNPNAGERERWALLKTAVQVKSNPVIPQSQWLEKAVSHTSEDAIDYWEPPAKWVGTEVTVSPLLTIWSAVDIKRHPNGSTGSFILLWLDDAPQADRSLLRSNWVEALRLFNFYQFLPHFYAVTTSGINQSRTLLPKLSNFQPGQTTEEDEQWHQLRELTVEEQLLPALDQMRQEGWQIPEAGYELVSDRNQVIAMAELAWIEHRIAVTLTEADQVAFTEAGWNAWEIEPFLQFIDIVGNTLRGGL
ncbi:MAG: DEAD/DEAH box helicase [Oscillatoriophycideae cyanobacterium NC_groundwater_1537_Pr4_S-0.65um_50_18]|nr:DEAD/DEAH box helicase [Oscillatoriophycideae cyanobacterium NC_groundwater_1537_Pr4_S-0.65um_50_18]